MRRTKQKIVKARVNIKDNNNCTMKRKHRLTNRKKKVRK